MNPTETILHSANVLVCTLGVVTASGAMVGAAPFVGGAMSIAALMGGARPKTSALDKRVGAMLTKSLNNPKVHLPQEAAKIVPQMIGAGALSDGEVMGAVRDPVKICAAMLGKLKDPEHCHADMQQAFERVVVPIFVELLNDRDVCDALRPAYEMALAGAIARLQKIVEQLKEQSDQTARRLGIQEGLLIGVARRYAANNPDDFDSALAGVEQALEVAARERDKGRLPGNVDDAVTAVMARVDVLNDEGRIDEAEAALWDEMARHDAAQLRLISKALAQAVLTRNMKRAVEVELKRLALDGGDFDALRAVQDKWYERGRDKGLRFDLEVAIGLAQASAARAGDADQRGTAANDLGIALATLGERESGTARLVDAVTAYTRALEERTQDRVPLDWAGTQFNLALLEQALAQKTNGPEQERHVRAALAYVEAALQVYDPDSSPYYFDKASALRNHLLNALQQS